MTTIQCHSSICQGPRRVKLFHEGETTSSKNHEERFNKLIKSNQPRKHKATRNDRKTLSKRSKKSDAREAQEENCANNSLVYVQFFVIPSTKATVQCGTVSLLLTRKHSWLLRFILPRSVCRWTNGMENNANVSLFFCYNFKQGAGRRKLFDDNFSVLFTHVSIVLFHLSSSLMLQMQKGGLKIEEFGWFESYVTGF